MEKLAKSASQPFKEFYLKQEKQPESSLKNLNTICGISTAIATYNQLIHIYGVFISKLIYFGPSRQGIGRFNRIEPVSKMVVSHDGRNLPDFLGNT